MKQNCEFRAGIYARLSKDDERRGESVSIENQKLMLSQYCETQGWTIVDCYVDDGFSGTSFDRPGFQRLMGDVRSGAVNLVLVKDLSRLGRDYVTVGQYTDCVFPMYGCRFVALGDGVDTYDAGDETGMIFKNVINDLYARDTSKKIRAIRLAGARSGRFMGSRAPFGYRRSDADRHKLEVEPAAAEIVRRIFRMREDGCSAAMVARELNREGVSPPSVFYEDKCRGAENSGRPVWSRETVRSILSNGSE